MKRAGEAWSPSDAKAPAAGQVARERRIRVEQTRLMLASVAGTYLAAHLLALLLVAGLWNTARTQALLAWCAAAMGLKYFSTVDARRRLALPMTPEHARQALMTRSALNVVQGIVWGCLPWLALSPENPGANLLVLVALASMVSGTMSLNASTPVSFIAFAMPLLALVAARLWLVDDRAYRALGAAAVVYNVSLALQARVMFRTARRSIELRFENLDLVERLRVESEHAEAARAEAERANTAKSKFLAAASHDLRQPLHAQGLFLAVLAATELDSGQRALLANLQSTSLAAGEMLNTLLDFSRIEAGAIRPCCQDFELQAIFNRVERELAPQADALGLAYRTRDTTQAVHSDPALVELILRNLVANAIRYTPRGGLLVASRRRGDEVWMEVWDTGVGIAPQDQAAVFREFHQVGSAGAGRRKGFGLGLAICEGLAHALHHRLWLNSTPRRGSVFRLALPAATAAPLRPSTHIQQAALPAGLRVLVLDDDELARTGMVGLLRSWGCQCQGTGTIATALALARQQRPDVLVCDFQLEGQATGLQAMTLFRQTFRPPPAMLLVTGDTDPQRLHDAKACAALLLRKPVPEALLRQGIAAAMDASRMPSRT